jgi:hypothetical protein
MRADLRRRWKIGVGIQATDTILCTTRQIRRTVSISATRNICVTVFYLKPVILKQTVSRAPNSDPATVIFVSGSQIERFSSHPTVPAPEQSDHSWQWDVMNYYTILNRLSCKRLAESGSLCWVATRNGCSIFTGLPMVRRPAKQCR